MALADLFRPKWKHSEPAVRADAVRKLETSEIDVLVRVLKNESDIAIRRIAVKKLDDPELLSEIATSDPDESLRKLAADKLTNLLVGLALSEDQQSSLAAVAKISDERALALIAQSSSIAAVQEEAIGRVSDQRLLAEAIRKMKEPSIRLATLRRIDNISLLRALVLEGSKDLALAALERIESGEALEEIVKKAKNKAVRTRAKRKLAARTVTTSTQAVADDADRQRHAQRVQLCLEVETLAWSSDWDHAGSQIEQAKVTWEELGVVPGDALEERFVRACQQFALREAQYQDERLKQEEARRETQRAQQRGKEVDTQNRVEGTQREELATDLVEPKSSLQPFDFDRSLIREEVEESPLRDEVFDLCYRIEGAIAEEDFDAAVENVRLLEDDFVELLREGGVDQVLADRYQEIHQRAVELDSKKEERRAQEAQENLKRLTAVCDRLDTLVATKEIKRIERGLSEASRAFRAPGFLPTATSLKDLRQRYDVTRKQLFAQLQELREVEDWKRWANLGPKLEICKQIEALEKEPDDKVMVQALKKLQNQWKKAGAVPKDRLEDLQQRYKAAIQKLDERRSAVREQLEQERAGNLAAKEAICAEAESYAKSEDWENSTRAIKALQEQWKAIGPVPKAKSDEVWSRFRAACDTVFERRRRQQERDDEGNEENVAAKDAICKRAEELAESNDWDGAGEAFRKLQREWHQIGPVPRKEAKELWSRYRTARETFFKRRRGHRAEEDANASAAREKLCTELEALSAQDQAESQTNIVEQTQSLRQAWLESAPAPRQHARKLTERFNRALTDVIERNAEKFGGTDLDPTVNQSRKEQLCDRLEQLIKQLGGGASVESEPSEREEGRSVSGDTEAMAEQLREALANNALSGAKDEQSEQRVAESQFRETRSAWFRVAPVPGEVGEALDSRFDRLCREIRTLTGESTRVRRTRRRRKPRGEVAPQEQK